MREGLPGVEAPERYTLPPPPPRYLLAGGLLLATFLTTTTVGAILYVIGRTDETTSLQPFFSWRALQAVWGDPSMLTKGLMFSLPLLFILFCHEMGHFLACRHHRIPSTLPYFLPSPFVIGTFGAFIRIRGRIPGRKELLDVGVAGPLAGFAALLPFLVLGVLWSSPALIAQVSEREADAMLYLPGSSLAVEFLSHLFHGDLPAGMILNLHPFALAASIGLLATALNLMPIGQLDGGHILYAVVGRMQRRLGWLLWLAVASLGFYWPGWFLISFLALFTGIRHPPVALESEPLDGPRRGLALTALVILLLSFTLEPIRTLFIRTDLGALAKATTSTVPGPTSFELAPRGLSSEVRLNRARDGK